MLHNSKLIIIYFFIKTILFISIRCENPIRTPNLVRKTYTGCNELKDDFKSDKFDCTLFHRCAYGYQYTYVCPEGTGFDAAKRVCNYIVYVPECTLLSQETSTKFPDISTTVSTSTAQSTSTRNLQVTQEPIEIVLSNNGCKFNLNDLERGIFCNSATFRSFYPLCCL